MTRKWSFFAGAVLLAGYVLFSLGAPPLAILAGIGLAAMYTGRRSHVV
jgi:predicted acyltransferase